MSLDTEVPSPEGVLPGEDPHALLVRAVQGSALLLLDPEGNIKISNPGAQAVTGYTEQELKGKSYSCFFSRSDQSRRVPEQVLNTAKERGYMEADGWMHRKDGKKVWANISLSPIRSDAGELRGFSVLVRDISALKAAESALFSSEQRFRMLVQGVRDYAIYMLDPKGYITNWNAGAALIKGYSAEEIIGRHFSTFYTEEDRRRGEPQRGLETALRANTFQNEAWRVRKDGSLFWASIVIDPIYDEYGKLLGFAKITRDITDKRRFEEKTARQRETLHQSQKLEALGRLTGSVAHDFNNMLAIIRTAAELLGSGKPLAHDMQHYVKMITDTSERGARLTGQLLAFARQQPLRLEIFNPATRVDGMRHVLQTTIGSRNELHVELAADLANVESDVSQFDTAILNLAINARDAMAEGGILTITARNTKLALEDDEEARDWVEVGVRDTGCGIDPATLPKIFEPFFTTKAVNKGTGLGLSQVYGYVKQSGGDIKVESTPNKGTSFILYLPKAKTDRVDSWDGLITPEAKEALPDAILVGAGASHGA